MDDYTDPLTKMIDLDAHPRYIKNDKIQVISNYSLIALNQLNKILLARANQ